MAGLTFTAISPKLPILKNPVPELEKKMRRFGGDGVKMMAKYPAQMPTKSGYIRKGSGGLGGSWRYKYGREGGSLVTTVESNLPYSVWVQGGGDSGPRQTAEMARRNWQTTDEALEPLWNGFLDDIQQAFDSSTH